MNYPSPQYSMQEAESSLSTAQRALLHRKRLMEKQKHLLLIDDDQELSELLTDYLELEGYRLTVAHDGEDGLRRARSGQHFDLVLLDVMLPHLNGFEVLQQLRQTHLTPVILLTAKDEDFDRIYGLELGADDYLSKPFNTRELLARIKALLRRVSYVTTSVMQPEMRVGPLTVNNQSQKVTLAETRIDFTGTEFSILQTLMVNRGKVTSKDDISQAVFGRDLAPFDRSIDMHVSNVRKKLAQNSDIEFIRTVRGGGYMLVEIWGG